jgi:hypothetical protein
VNQFPGGGDLYFVLDREGALVAYREKLAPWAGVVAFTSEEAAAQFCRDSACQGCEIAAVTAGDEASLRAIIWTSTTAAAAARATTSKATGSVLPNRISSVPRPIEGSGARGVSERIPARARVAGDR